VRPLGVNPEDKMFRTLLIAALAASVAAFTALHWTARPPAIRLAAPDATGPIERVAILPTPVPVDRPADPPPLPVRPADPPPPDSRPDAVPPAAVVPAAPATEVVPAPEELAAASTATEAPPTRSTRSEPMPIPEAQADPASPADGALLAFESDLAFLTLMTRGQFTLFRRDGDRWLRIGVAGALPVEPPAAPLYRLRLSTVPAMLRAQETQAESADAQWVVQLGEPLTQRIAAAHTGPAPSSLLILRSGEVRATPRPAASESAIAVPAAHEPPATVSR
jgi:hypothetical protein